jgi:hypothetical protein
VRAAEPQQVERRGRADPSGAADDRDLHAGFPAICIRS